MQDAYFSEKGSVGDWVAKPKTKLNDCTTSHQWELVAANSGTAIDGVYPNFTISNGTSSDVCLALTASWNSLTGSH